MTLSTQLTLLRIPLAFLIMALLYLPGWVPRAIALVSFLLAAFTDWLDGHLARQWNQTSALGALLDPIADKVLVLGLFLVFVQLGMAPAWMVLVIIVRESLITGVRLVAAGRRIVLSAAREGKQKTASQLFAILVIHVELVIGARDPQLAPMMNRLRMASLWLTTGLTVYSGLTFFRTNRAALLNYAGEPTE